MKKLLFTLLALALSLPLQAATLKVATVTPEGSGWMKDMRASAKEINERTEGRVQIKYYGGGVMGTDQKVLGRIRIGPLIRVWGMSTISMPWEWKSRVTSR